MCILCPNLKIPPADLLIPNAQQDSPRRENPEPQAPETTPERSRAWRKPEHTSSRNSRIVSAERSVKLLETLGESKAEEEILAQDTTESHLILVITSPKMSNVSRKLLTIENAPEDPLLDPKEVFLPKTSKRGLNLKNY